MVYGGKRDRLLESLSLGSRKCPECQIWGSLLLEEREPVKVSCLHCDGEWSLKDDGHSLSRERWDNITPHYIEEGA